MLVIGEIRISRHSLRSVVGMGSRSQCEFDIEEMVLRTVASATAVKDAKVGGGLLGVTLIHSAGLDLTAVLMLQILSMKNELKAFVRSVREGVVGKATEDLGCINLFRLDHSLLGVEELILSDRKEALAAFNLWLNLCTCCMYLDLSTNDFERLQIRSRYRFIRFSCSRAGDIH